MNIKRKLEKAFVAYLESLSDLDGLTKVAGSNATIEEFPILVVHCRQAPPASDLPPGTREYNAELIVQLVTQSDDDATTPTSDDRLAVIDDAMRDVAEIRALINNFGVIPDTRAVQEIHIKDVLERDQDGAVEGRHFIDTLEYEIPCGDFDDDV